MTISEKEEENSAPQRKKSRTSLKRNKSKSQDLSTNQVPHLVDFENIDSNWITIDDTSFTFFVASNTPAISTNMISNPFAHTNDGYVDVVFARASNRHTTRLNVIGVNKI